MKSYSHNKKVYFYFYDNYINLRFFHLTPFTVNFINLLNLLFYFLIDK